MQARARSEGGTGAVVVGVVGGGERFRGSVDNQLESFRRGCGRFRGSVGEDLLRHRDQRVRRRPRAHRARGRFRGSVITLTLPRRDPAAGGVDAV